MHGTRHIDPITITPYIDNQLKPGKKEKIILSVGRFFPHLHNKNQVQIIETFKKLKNKYKEFLNYKLILAGGLKNEDRSYFEQLKSLSGDSSIIFKLNISLDELYGLYGLSTYFWHFTGLGVDEKNHPDSVEHFGIAPLEAASSGCLVLCHNSGGPKEIFTNEENGVLFENENDLIKSIKKLEDNLPLKNKIVSNGVKLAKNKYNYQLFKNKVLALV
ncbi:MAG: Glycosyl transferase [Candidatus Roizmanbacteria bacterium GW2011_GWA2_35_8]|uniref:Glycosyl transferase n=1 Tax=Candidatus Roizmanbacteria bacterium GW2011_GWA2_35_8 TaxID=1618479 RepID=A0A0G0DE89_9BACT|nr:MAG: Glycosyl transferase [Candidatus Roizmanbacteria bacterium GW2011_GWA2_35_8]